MCGEPVTGGAAGADSQAPVERRLQSIVRRRVTATALLAVVLALFGICSRPASAEIIKGPYLRNVKADGITVMWESDRPTIGVMHYGKTADYGSVAAEKEPRRIHEIVISGLDVETPYHYRVWSGKDASEDRVLRTAVRPGSPFRAVYIGDSQSNPQVFRKTVARISAESPNLILHTGDLVSHGRTYSEWERFFFAPARALIDHVAIFPALGNHEGNHEHYYQFFSLPTNRAWYSFGFGNAHFVVLDANQGRLAGPDDPQVKWLINDLRESKAQWKLVSVHQAVFTSGGHNYNAERYRVKNLLHPIFEKYGVDMVFTGHDHHYERTLPIKAGHGARPVTYVVSGNSGTPLRYVGKQSWTAFAERVFGYSLVTIAGRRLELQAKNLNGGVIDHLTIDKGDGAVDSKYLASALAFSSIVDHEEAARLFQEAHELANQGEKQKQPALLQQALAKLDSAFKLAPSFCEALVAMGQINRALGREDLAIGQLRQGIRLMPVYPASYEELIKIYINRRQYDEAIRLTREWAKVEPDKPSPDVALAGVYEQQGKIKDALASLLRALQIVPSEPKVHIAAARLYEKQGSRSEAQKHYEEAMKWMDAEDTVALQQVVRDIEALRRH
jgi:tetratricopeptide (TPR) repeat protein